MTGQVFCPMIDMFINDVPVLGLFWIDTTDNGDGTIDIKYGCSKDLRTVRYAVKGLVFQRCIEDKFFEYMVDGNTYLFKLMSMRERRAILDR